MKKLLTVVFALVLCLGLTGCGSSEDKATDTGTSGIHGTVRLNGSTSMEKLVNGLLEVIKEKHPNLTLEPQFTGSSAGIEALLAGTADIGNSSRELKDTEKQKGIVENIVAIDGIAVITDKANKASDLTTEQLTKIYKGEITNWKEVGGSDQQIVVIGREAGSGTRGAFEEILKVADLCKYAQEIDSTGAVVAKVASIPGAIGYVSLDVVNDTTKALKLSGVEASEKTIKDGSYALQRPFVMATKGEIDKQSEEIKAVFAYLESEEGQTLIKNVGLISAK